MATKNKLKLSNILLNYDEYVKRRNSIGYVPTTYNTRNIRHLNLMFSELISDISLFNDLINIFDYTPKEKIQILQWINKLGFKKKTWIDMLINKNREIEAEDDLDEEFDMQLFESENLDKKLKGIKKKFKFDGEHALKKIDKLSKTEFEDEEYVIDRLAHHYEAQTGKAYDKAYDEIETYWNETSLNESSNFDAFNYRKPGKFEVHYSDGIRRMTSFSNWQKALKYAVEKIESGKIKSLEIFKDESGFHSTTQEEYLELWWGKGSYWDNFNKRTGEVSDREYIQNLNESTFPISKSELLYLQCLKESKQSKNFVSVTEWNKQDLNETDGLILMAFDIVSKLIDNSGEQEGFTVTLHSDDDTITVLKSETSVDFEIENLNSFNVLTRAKYSLKPLDINLYLDTIIAKDYQLDPENKQYMGYLVIDTDDYTYNNYLHFVLKNLNTYNRYLERKHNLKCIKQGTDVIFETISINNLNESK